MSEFKGTPGPWTVIQQYEDELTVVDGDGFEIVAADGMPILAGWEEKGFSHWGDEGGHRELSIEETCANARLIAAAPELLSISQRLIKWDTDYPVNGSNGYAGLKELDAIIADGKSAIAKALGE